MIVKPMTKQEAWWVGSRNTTTQYFSRATGGVSGDPRLQAIADAWNEVRPSEKEMLRNDWRMLAPVITLLDALTKEDDS